MKVIPDFEDYKLDEHGGLFKSGKRINGTIKDGRVLYRLTKNGKRTPFSRHQLVAICYLGHRKNGNKLIVHHKDEDPMNDHYTNLKIVTEREHKKIHSKGASNYVGVNFDRGKWCAKIWVRGRTIPLGRFDKEEDARNAYNNYLKENNV